MTSNITSAVFENRTQAERAVNELRNAGIPDADISIIAFHDGETQETDGGGHETHNHNDHDNKASGAAKGLLAGGGVGAVAGLAALAIPGVGPFIAAGAIAETLGVVGSAAAVSGAVGAAAGGLTGALVDYGISRDHAEHYEQRIKDGAVFVGVAAPGPESEQRAIRAVLHAAGGESPEMDERTT